MIKDLVFNQIIEHAISDGMTADLAVVALRTVLT